MPVGEENKAGITPPDTRLPTSPSDSYVAQPPARIALFSKDGARALWSYMKLLGLIIVQPVLPFRPAPGLPANPPEPSKGVDDKQLAQCVKIAEREETTRKYLEEKARSTFGMTSFVAPLLFAVLIFLLGRTSSSVWNVWGFLFGSLALALLILSFLSVLRAQAVQERQELFLQSIIDQDKKDFRIYDAGFYARGLLWCASVNTAMNAHIAQFVRGAQILTGLTAITTVLAAIPAAFLFSNPVTPVSKTEVVGSVAVTASQVEEVRSQLSQIAAEVKLLNDRQQFGKEILQLQFRLQELEQRVARQAEAAKRENNPSPAPK